jgi:hypothetical protein
MPTPGNMTETYGDTNAQPPPPPPPGPPQFAPPTTPVKVCPRCSAQNQTAAKTCPSCGKKYAKGHTVLKVLLAVTVGGLLLLGGCIALIAGGVNQANNDAKKTGITRAQFNDVQEGTSQSSVEADLGKPENKQEFENNFPGVDDATQSSSCIYYHEKGQGLTVGGFQLCFTNGDLTSKNSF